MAVASSYTEAADAKLTPWSRYDLVSFGSRNAGIALVYPSASAEIKREKQNQLPTAIVHFIKMDSDIVDFKFIL